VLAAVEAVGAVLSRSRLEAILLHSLAATSRHATARATPRAAPEDAAARDASKDAAVAAALATLASAGPLPWPSRGKPSDGSNGAGGDEEGLAYPPGPPGPTAAQFLVVCLQLADWAVANIKGRRTRVYGEGMARFVRRGCSQQLMRQ